MAKSDLTRPLRKVTFHCLRCKWTFEAAPARVDDDASPERAHHPYRYFADCAVCMEYAEQAGWEVALLKAWASATGPRTEEGKAASAANLAGHPTPEEAQRTRFNAMKHGLNAKVATYFPAKPDGYSFCKGCEVEREWCRAQPACVKQTEIFMLHQAAFDQRDPKRLMGIYSDLHAAVFAVLRQILQTIIGDGVELITPKYATSDGRVIFVEWEDKYGEKHAINDVQAHPLFRPLGELISRLNLSLADMGMTVRELERDTGEDPGFLKPAAGGAATLEDFSRRQAENIAALRGHLEQARANRERDPVLLEHRAQNGDDAA